jgi:hypothetical protein
VCERVVVAYIHCTKGMTMNKVGKDEKIVKIIKRTPKQKSINQTFAFVDTLETAGPASGSKQNRVANT